MKFRYVAKKLGGLVSIGLLLLPGFAIGAVWTAGLIPEQPYVHSGLGYFSIQDSGNAEVINPDNCTSEVYYLVSKDTALAKDMYAMLLAANLGGKKVIYYLSGCVDGVYPEVKHLRIAPD